MRIGSGGSSFRCSAAARCGRSRREHSSRRESRGSASSSSQRIAQATTCACVEPRRRGRLKETPSRRKTGRRASAQTHRGRFPQQNILVRASMAFFREPPPRRWPVNCARRSEYMRRRAAAPNLVGIFFVFILCDMLFYSSQLLMHRPTRCRVEPWLKISFRTEHL